MAAAQFSDYSSNYYSSYYNQFNQQQYPMSYYPTYESNQTQHQNYAEPTTYSQHYGQQQQQQPTTQQTQPQNSLNANNYGYHQLSDNQNLQNYNQYYYPYELNHYNHQQQSYQQTDDAKSLSSTSSSSQSSSLKRKLNQDEDEDKAEGNDSPALRALLTNPAKKLKYTPAYYNGVVSPASSNYDRIVPEIVPPSPNKTDDSIDFLDQNLSLNHIHPSPSSQSIIDRISTPPLSPKEDGPSKTAASSPSHSNSNNSAVNQNWIQNGAEAGKLIIKMFVFSTKY